MTAFPAFDPDYTAHLAIAHAIEAHGLWPLVYHGMNGGHLFVLLLRHAFGTSFTVAMALTFALALVAIVTALARDLKSAAVVLGFSVPLVLHMASHGFFAQTVALAPYAWALRALTEKQFSRATLLTLLGAFFYPDCAMFLLPAIAWQAQKLRLLSVAVSALLFLAQAGELSHDGAALTVWTPQLLFAVPLLLTSKHQRTTIATFALVAGAMILTSLITQGAVTYYARKNLYALLLLAPLVARHALIPLAIYVGFSLLPHARVPLWQWHTPPFDARAESCAVAFAGVCTHPAVIPPPGPEWERAQQVLGFAAFLGEQDEPFAPSVHADNDCVVSQNPSAAIAACPPWYLAPRALSP